MALLVESLEDRLTPSATPTNFDQYMLEVINRGRAAPATEAARLGISLNEGLPPGTISTAAKQPLAFNPSLIQSAQNYTATLLGAYDYFDHYYGGATPQQRMTAAGYVISAPGGYAENIDVEASTGPYTVSTATTDVQYNDLFIDSSVAGRGHRTNLMNPNLKEIGIGVSSNTTYQGLDTPPDHTNYNAVLTTQDFAYSAADPYPFLTGVVFNDTAGTKFYAPGEGLGGVTVTATPTDGTPALTAITWSSGGYSLPLAPGKTYTITLTGGGVGTTSPIDLFGVAASHTVTIPAQGASNAEIDFTNSGTAVTPPATTTTFVSTAPLPAGTSHYGEPVTFQATVTAPGFPNPTAGAVVFVDATANAVLGTGTLNGSNQASYTTTASQLVTLGSHTILASYQGSSAAYAASPAASMTQIVLQAPTSIVISSAPVTYGQPVTLTATVSVTSPSSPGSLPTHGAQLLFFADNYTFIGYALAPVATTPGSATYTFTTTATQLSIGTHPIRAIWASPEYVATGDINQGNFRSSVSAGWGGAANAAFQQVVNPIATTTVLVSSPTYWAIGIPTTFVVIVFPPATVPAGAPAAPPGSVTFTIDSVPTAPMALTIPANATYSYAVFTMASAFFAGTHTASAAYTPSSSYFASSISTLQTQNVRKATSLSLNTSPNPGTTTAPANTSITFLAILSTNGAGTPTGTMNFYDNGNLIGTGVPITSSSSGATYKLTTSFSTVGKHTITARYNENNQDALFDPADASFTLTIS